MNAEKIIATQTAVNDIYREALIELVTAQNGPLDNFVIADLMQGGLSAAEYERGAMEPYVPALLSLVANGTFVYYPDEHGTYQIDLTSRASADQITTSITNHAEHLSRLDGEVNYDDPRMTRRPSATIIEAEQKRLAARSEGMGDIEALLRELGALQEKED